jgi:hypothetical protein
MRGPALRASDLPELLFYIVELKGTAIVMHGICAAQA